MIQLCIGWKMEKYFQKKDKKKREKTQPRAVEDILKTVMKDIGMSQMHELNTISEMWCDVVGDVIGQNSRPVGFDKGKLTVEVNNMVWKQELEGFHRTAIIAKINRKAGNKLVNRMFCVLNTK